MFSKENRRLTMILIAVVIVAAFTMADIVSVINKGNAKDALVITAFASVVIGQLFVMAKQEQTRRESSEERRIIRQDVSEIKDTLTAGAAGQDPGRVAVVIQKAAEQVSKAQSEPAAGQEQMPKTREELESLLKVFSHEICNEFVAQSKIDAEKVAKETVEKTKEQVADAARETVRIVVEELRSQGAIK